MINYAPRYFKDCLNFLLAPILSCSVSNKTNLNQNVRVLDFPSVSLISA